jgi:hypothetical protein
VRSCGGSYFAYRRALMQKRTTKKPYLHHKAAYNCNWRQRVMMHSKKSIVRRCYNKEVKAGLLEAQVFSMIESTMLDPEKLKGCMEYFKESARLAQLELEIEEDR